MIQRIAEAKNAPYFVAEGTSNVTFRLQNDALAKELVKQALKKTGRLEFLDRALARIPLVN